MPYDIQLLNRLYLIEGTDLSCSEHSSPEEITMAYQLRKHSFSSAYKNHNTKKYQAGRSTAEAVRSVQYEL